MKTRTKRNICIVIVIFNFFLLLGFSGSCELGYIEIKEYIIKCLIVGACTIMPALKSGLMK